MDRISGYGPEGLGVRVPPGVLKVCGNSSVVECDLAKVDVVGSNPISRSKNLEYL